MPCRSDLIGSNEDPERRNRVEFRYRRLLKGLRYLRDRFAQLRFYQIDHAVGRASGFLTKVFSGREDALTVGRFLTILDRLGVSLGELALFADMEEPIPPGAPGYLRSLRSPRKKPTSNLRDLPQTLKWAQQLRVSEDVATSDLDISAVTELANRDSVAATLLAQHSLEQLRAETKVISLDTAEQVCRLITFLGHQHRNTGHLAAALELLDLAFVLEARIDRPAVRALIYRTSSHLLSDMGLLRDALFFAHRAERASTAIGDADGLGRSLYVKASMYFYRGEYLRAAHNFRSCLLSLPSANLTFRVTAQHAIAYCLLELGQVAEAGQEVDSLSELLASEGVQLTTKLQANDLELRANLASHRGQMDSAEQLFDDADRAYSLAGAELDRLVLLLRRTQHALRHNDIEQAFRLVESASPIASRLEANETVRGVVLELFRLAKAGALKLDLVEEATRHLLFPGTRITRNAT